MEVFRAFRYAAFSLRLQERYFSRRKLSNALAQSPVLLAIIRNQWLTRLNVGDGFVQQGEMWFCAARRNVVYCPSFGDLNSLKNGN
jgi:hypothetical protein